MPRNAAPCARAVSSSKANCALLNFGVTDVYAASATEVFFVGNFNQNGAVKTGVAFWDGNSTASCGNAQGFAGLAYLDIGAYAQTTAAPISPTSLLPNTAEASGTPTRPSPVISKTPNSFVEPKRFFTARRMRNWCEPSPSNDSTASTMCSTTRGPAIWPS